MEGGSEEQHLDFFGMVAKLATLFGAMVMVPLFYVDSPGDFSRASALTEHEHVVHIVLKQRYAIAAHGDFTCNEDQFAVKPLEWIVTHSNTYLQFEV
ncbi:hypothetical protein V8E53_003410 [Lactarius tabidus]